MHNHLYKDQLQLQLDKFDRLKSTTLQCRPRDLSGCDCLLDNFLAMALSLMRFASQA